MIKITSGTMKVTFPAMISVIYTDNNVAVQIQRTTAKNLIIYIRHLNDRWVSICENNNNLTIAAYESSNNLRRKFRGVI